MCNIIIDYYYGYKTNGASPSEDPWEKVEKRRCVKRGNCYNLSSCTVIPTIYLQGYKIFIMTLSNPRGVNFTGKTMSCWSGFYIKDISYV